MAIAWLTVLQSVPWAEVVSNAPKVAAGAKKLWNAVAKKTPPVLADSAPQAQAALSPEAQAIAALEARILALEAASADLQNQMVASSELIQALAEQNTQLIIRVEVMRRRLWWLGSLFVLGGLVVAGSLALLFTC
ncbi:hypothetical protein SAMN05216344_11564 [Polaromonas sp. OV174]|uniref:hypothetical protein n=1 Tax=Polaromonas sp. OV174 TaxID=1855300 RepID=UPI0008DF508C|nr:hypothetical protein [Polaromonas sp. OV174]SFC36963.1 hypothetical protein SAMN05216344_11564 [Polaromonas sp. OV174]